MFRGKWNAPLHFVVAISMVCFLVFYIVVSSLLFSFPNSSLFIGCEKLDPLIVNAVFDMSSVTPMEPRLYINTAPDTPQVKHDPADQVCIQP